MAEFVYLVLALAHLELSPRAEWKDYAFRRCTLIFVAYFVLALLNHDAHAGCTAFQLLPVSPN